MGCFFPISSIIAVVGLNLPRFLICDFSLVFFSFWGRGGGNLLLKNMAPLSHSLFCRYISLWDHLTCLLSSLFSFFPFFKILTPLIDLFLLFGCGM